MAESLHRMFPGHFPAQVLSRSGTWVFRTRARNSQRHPLEVSWLPADTDARTLSHHRQAS